MSKGLPSDGLNPAVAAVLNGERTSAKLSFDELATRSGISSRTLMRLLSKTERDIDINVLSAIARVFHLSASEVLTRAEEWQVRNSPEEIGRQVGEAVKKRRREQEDQSGTG